MQSVRALLEGILDYAGLFPPAQLGLDEALRKYREYRVHRHGWMIGRLVLPLQRIESAHQAQRVTLVCRGEGLQIPVLPPNVESLEVAGTLACAVDRFTWYEVDWRQDFRRVMQALPAGSGIKLRTGGTSPDQIPPVETMAQFLWATAERGLPIKFTAGLHHPFPDAGEHGFLNVFAARLPHTSTKRRPTRWSPC